ncbi:GTPase [Mesomycoplasma neurolyticum]|uniref:Ribosome biogenesis GTPase A n=2 Tax=Mesomycoplasma neurolyticum TaxID=2120 RepID=A0A449A5P0_9BACT|nr:GTPase [Mesomycoplasma neurolyticum]
MSKAIKEIKEKEKICDLFVIVLDARAPISTYNEEFDKISPHKPRLFVITKKDYGDLKKLKLILKKFENNSKSKVILVNLKNNFSKKIILENINELLKEKKQKDLQKGLLKPQLRVFVVGVPNSGKSTLINLLASSKAKVGDKPGVTKSQQWIKAKNIQLLDTPGILWPKFDDQFVAMKLAIIGSINPDIIPKQSFFTFGYRLLSKYYPEKILNLNLTPTEDEVEIYNNLYLLAKNKNFLLKNNKLDVEKTSQWFRNYLRKITNVTYD